MREIVGYLKKNINDQDTSVTFQKIKNIENTIEKMKSQCIIVPDELKKMKLSLYLEYENQKELGQIKNYLDQEIKAVLFPNIRFPNVKRKPKMLKNKKHKQQQLPLYF